METKNKLWKKCLECKDKCCCKDNLSFPLFLTSQESLKINRKFFWVFWKLKCLILDSGNKEEFEKYLQEHEQNLIPKFKEYLNDYAKFRLKEFLSKYQYVILREVKIS